MPTSRDGLDGYGGILQALDPGSCKYTTSVGWKREAPAKTCGKPKGSCYGNEAKNRTIWILNPPFAGVYIYYCGRYVENLFAKNASQSDTYGWKRKRFLKHVFACVYTVCIHIYIYIHIPRESKDQTLPLGSRESFTWITLKTILCLVLDFHGIYIYYNKSSNSWLISITKKE